MILLTHKNRLIGNLTGCWVRIPNLSHHEHLETGVPDLAGRRRVVSERDKAMSEDLDRELNTLVGTLMAKPPVSLSLIKKSLEGTLDMSLKDVLEWEAAYQSVML